MKPCLLCTVTYNRLEMTTRCLESLLEMTNAELYTLIIIDNGSTDGTIEYLRALDHPSIEDIFYNSSNLGTAKALNQGWKIGHQRGQYVGKLDNDVIFYDDDWLDKMKYVLDKTEDVGIVGLKRRDLEEKPNHHDAFFRTSLYTLPNDQVIEVARHIIGTCWLVSSDLLRKIRGLIQIGPYGLDDALYCHRAHLAGFLTVFVPDVAIEHIDPGHPMYPDYTQWKIDVATEVFESGEYQRLLEDYEAGARSLSEDFVTI